MENLSISTELHDPARSLKVSWELAGNYLPLITSATAAASRRARSRRSPRPALTTTALMPSGIGSTSAERNSGIVAALRSEEHTPELQSRGHLVCRLLLEKKKDDRRDPCTGSRLQDRTEG